MHIAILGRQPALGVAELERLYGSHAVSWFGDASARIATDSFDFARLGGSLKAGRVTLELPGGNWRRVSTAIVEHYLKAWASTEHKLTLGISAYGFDRVSPRDVQGTGIILKKKLRAHDVSIRLVPNQEAALGTASSHHNKLGSSPHRVELLVVRGSSGRIIVAESVGAQNITAFAARDQARPRTDAFVGMLPPKLARMLVNLTGGVRPVGPTSTPARVARGGAAPIRPMGELGANRVTGPESSDLRAEHAGGGAGDDGSGVHAPETDDGRSEPRKADPMTILDPFCGTGVVLQEAALLGYRAYGTDLSDKMVAYSRENLDWLNRKYHLDTTVTIEQGDARDHTWQSPIDAVVCEAYLGQPFSAPPSPAKLTEVRGNCDHIISSFLANIGRQLAAGTPLVIAVPAWSDGTGYFTHLPFISQLDKLGYRRIDLQHVRPEQLLYYREGQVVARELLILQKS